MFDSVDKGFPLMTPSFLSNSVNDIETENSNWIIKNSANCFKAIGDTVYNSLQKIEDYDGKIKKISGIDYHEWISNQDYFLLLTAECKRIMVLYPKNYETLNNRTIITALRNIGTSLKNL